jgi:hypothetical protein
MPKGQTREKYHLLIDFDGEKHRIGFPGIDANVMAITDDNPNIVALRKPLEFGRRHRVTLRVRVDSFSAELDGQPALKFAIGDFNLGPNTRKFNDTSRVGVAADAGTVKFDRIEIEEISGKGRLVRRPIDDKRLVRRFLFTETLRILSFSERHVASAFGATVWDTKTGVAVHYPLKNWLSAIAADSCGSAFFT